MNKLKKIFINYTIVKVSTTSETKILTHSVFEKDKNNFTCSYLYHNFLFRLKYSRSIHIEWTSNKQNRNNITLFLLKSYNINVYSSEYTDWLTILSFGHFDFVVLFINISK